MIVVKKESLADEIAMQVTEDGEGFHSLARRHSIDETTRHYRGHLGSITRKMLSPDISAKVFNTNPGDLLGPFKKDEYIQLILVEEVIKAELTDNVKEAIKERIFEQGASRFYEDGIRVDSE